MRLSDLIGQDAARTALLRAVERGHLGHAYLFEGPPSVGKRGAAYGLAMALACPVAPGTGCGDCETCRRIGGGIHPDVPTFGPSGAGGQIVVDDAKAILALARSRPHEAPARVIVIDDADALNANAANCLLKTLEEPLAGNHIVLVSSAPDRLLPTIRSRAQRIRFRPLSPAALLALAEARGLDAARAQIAVALADGSAARLLDAAPPPSRAPSDDEDDEDDEAADTGARGVAGQLAALRAAVTARGVASVFDFAGTLAADKAGKQDLPRLVGLLGRLYRDALAVAAGAPELAILGKGSVPGKDPARGQDQGQDQGQASEADRFARDFQALVALGVDRLGRGLAAIADTQVALTANVNPALAFERLLLALRRCELRPTAAAPARTRDAAPARGGAPRWGARS